MFVDELERITVASHFFFVPVAQSGLAKNERSDTRLVHLDAFDAVGGNRAFNQRVLPQHLQLLRRLTSEQFLFAPRLAQISQIPGRPGGNRRRFSSQLAQGHHGQQAEG